MRYRSFYYTCVKRECGVSLISIYKKQLREANDILACDQAQQRDIDKQIRELQEENLLLSKKIEEDITNVITKGMLYFDSSKREYLLNEAEQLSYSQMQIDKIRCIDDSNWNADNVDFETITVLQSMEQYVSDNSPGLLAKLGKFVLRGEDK